MPSSSVLGGWPQKRPSLASMNTGKLEIWKFVKSQKACQTRLFLLIGLQGGRVQIFHQHTEIPTRATGAMEGNLSTPQTLALNPAGLRTLMKSLSRVGTPGVNHYLGAPPRRKASTIPTSAVIVTKPLSQTPLYPKPHRPPPPQNSSCLAVTF